MYIQINNTQHPITGVSFGASLSWSGLTGITTPVSGTITTHSDDGFVLRSDDTAEWEHQWLENGTLTLSHEPKPEPPPDPPEPDSDLITGDEALHIIIGGDGDV